MLKSNRILIVDDTESIHQDFYKILAPSQAQRETNLDDLEHALFSDGSERPVVKEKTYKVDSAFQGEEGFEMVLKAKQEEYPYALIFMDVRMPPGWDGIETIARIWKECPYTEMVIVTAYSDYSWEKMLNRIGSTDRLIFIKKPFDRISIKQLALTLTNKWELSQLTRQYVEEIGNLENEINVKMEQLKQVLNGLHQNL